MSKNVWTWLFSYIIDICWHSLSFNSNTKAFLYTTSCKPAQRLLSSSNAIVLNINIHSAHLSPLLNSTPCQTLTKSHVLQSQVVLNNILCLICVSSGIWPFFALIWKDFCKIMVTFLSGLSFTKNVCAFFCNGRNSVITKNINQQKAFS